MSLKLRLQLSLLVFTAMATTGNSLLLAGQRVLVTGAGRGIGQAIAQLCHEQGANVAICARTATQLQETAQQLTWAPPSSEKPEYDDDDNEKVPSLRRVLSYTVDVTQPDQVKDMVTSIVQTWGGIDVLINNAGRGQAHKGNLTELSSSDFTDLLQLNVVAVHTVTAAVVPYMKEASSSSLCQIINVSSKAGKVGLPNMSHYVASKFAVEGLTASWASELQSHNIRVNSISPGMVNTVSFPKPSGRPGVRTAASIADGLFLLLAHSNVTGCYVHVDELDLVRSRGLPDERALKSINEVNFADTLEAQDGDGQCSQT